MEGRQILDEEMEDLIRAVRMNNVPLAKQLVGGGVNVNGVDYLGRSALYWAANGGFIESVKLLLEVSADPNKAAEDGWTPLYSACNKGSMECVKTLIEYKADVDTKTRSSYSPLHLATHLGHLQCMNILVQSGASLYACTKGSTPKPPLAWAIDYTKPDAFELLLDKGAKMSNVPTDMEIPVWVQPLLEKRRKVIRSNLVLYGVLRLRIRKIGKDMTKMISSLVWSTRFNKIWE